jgi:hypothetical protein
VIPLVSREVQLANATSLANASIRSPLARLLHALNQPLTGLQCSMEVALPVRGLSSNMPKACGKGWN